jgi:hypothetical protein
VRQKLLSQSVVLSYDRNIARQYYSCKSGLCPVHFISHFASRGKWYETFTCAAGPNQFAVLFLEFTARKQAGQAARAARH